MATEAIGQAYTTAAATILNGEAGDTVARSIIINNRSGGPLIVWAKVAGVQVGSKLAIMAGSLSVFQSPTASNKFTLMGQGEADGVLDACPMNQQV